MSGSVGLSYSDELGLCGRLGLWEERARLRARRQALHQDTCALAFTNYPTFISAAQCCTDISKDFGTIQDQLGTLEEKVPKLLNVCQKFQEKSTKVSSTWMLSQLLGRLKTQIQLPECLKVVGFVRRMDVFTETELRIKFLQSREVHFQSVLSTALTTDPDPHSRLCKVIELTRINVFDTITQYRALFSDDDPVLTTQGTFSCMTYRQIFSSWLYRRLQIFMATLGEGLKANKLEDQSLESLLGQVMYFGQSLGRVGFDFRLQLVPLFTNIILSRAQEALDHGLAALEESLKDLKHSLPPKPPQHSPGELPATQGLEAPATIIAFHPLAEICNAVIVTLNECRYCAPLVASVELPKQIEAFLGEATKLLNDYHERALKTPTAPAASYEAMIRTYNDDVIPYVQSCCETIFHAKASQALIAI